MKRKLSITLGEDTFRQIEELARQNNFRNRSHVVEFAVRTLAKEKKVEQ